MMKFNMVEAITLRHAEFLHSLVVIDKSVIDKLFLST